MYEYPLITKKQVRKNKKIRQIQKNSRKRYKHLKGKSSYARISKIVKLKEGKSFFDISGEVKYNGYVDNGSTNQILDVIKKSGLTGLSGNGFSTAKKIEAVIESVVKEKYLIVNGVECDPGLLHDSWLIKHNLTKIEEGISILEKMIPFQSMILVTKELCVPNNKKLQLHLAPDRYPIGEERILIQEVLKQVVAENEIPATNGILVLNIQTVLAIGEIVKGIHKPGTRYSTIADYKTGEAVVAKIMVGTKLTEILKKTLGEQQGKPVFTGGGVMMGHEVQSNGTADLTTNFVAFSSEVIFSEASKCKKCGACSRKCPMKIKVHKIIQMLEKNKNSDVSLYHPEMCIHCGTCTYHCRAGKNIMKTVVEKGQDSK